MVIALTEIMEKVFMIYFCSPKLNLVCKNNVSGCKIFCRIYFELIKNGLLIFQLLKVLAEKDMREKIISLFLYIYCFN